MAAIILGQQGCLNADLAIAQSQALSIVITHEDEDGQPIDDTGKTGYCRMQRDGYDDFVLDQYLTVGAATTLAIPGSVTAQMADGTWNWDIFVDDVRLVYGKARVYDTYARD